MSQASRKNYLAVHYIRSINEVEPWSMALSCCESIWPSITLNIMHNLLSRELQYMLAGKASSPARRSVNATRATSPCLWQGHALERALINTNVMQNA